MRIEWSVVLRKQTRRCSSIISINGVGGGMMSLHVREIIQKACQAVPRRAKTCIAGCARRTFDVGKGRAPRAQGRSVRGANGRGPRSDTPVRQAEGQHDDDHPRSRVGHEARKEARHAKEKRTAFGCTLNSFSKNALHHVCTHNNVCTHDVCLARS